MNTFQFLLLLLFFVTFGSGIHAFSQSSEVIESIAQSHIDANVPAAADFDEFLKRDLLAYFSPEGDKDTAVEYQLFRKEPTQTGIAYPKFYAWILIKRKNVGVKEGAVRLAAIEKKKFAITDFLSRENAIKDPEAAYGIFPRAVADMINKKAETN